MYYARATLFLLVCSLPSSFAGPISRAALTAANGITCIESDPLCNKPIDLQAEPVPVVKCSTYSESCITTTTSTIDTKPIQILESETSKDNNTQDDEADLIPTPPDTTTKFTIPTIILLSVLAVMGITYGLYKSQTILTSLPHLRDRLKSISVPIPTHLPTISSASFRKVRNYIPIPATWRMNENTLVRWAHEDMGLLDITDEDFEHGLRGGSNSSTPRHYPKYEFEVEEFEEVKQKKGLFPSGFSSFTSQGGFTNYGSAWN